MCIRPGIDKRMKQDTTECTEGISVFSKGVSFMKLLMFSVISVVNI